MTPQDFCEKYPGVATNVARAIEPEYTYAAQFARQCSNLHDWAKRDQFVRDIAALVNE